MDETHGNRDQGKAHDRADAERPPAVLATSDVGQYSNREDPHTQATEPAPENKPPSPLRRWITIHLDKLKHDVGFNEWLMLLATIVMAGSTVAYTHYAGKQIEMSERPWIGIDSVIVDELRFDPDVKFVLYIALRNTGHLPAAVAIHARFSHRGDAILSAERECDIAKKESGLGTPWTVIPGSPWRYRAEVSESVGRVEKNASAQGILACAVYRYGDNWHQTPFHISVSLASGGGRLFSGPAPGDQFRTEVLTVGRVN